MHSSNMPLISIIMNCYNSDEYLSEAIDSVINQTYKNWELIFWDNQSTDKSAEIVKSYNDKRIKYFYAPLHTKLGEARNFAIDKANGKWVAFLDCDDLWLQERLSLQIESLNNKNKEVGLIYTLTETIDETGNSISKSELFPSDDIHDQLLIYGNFITFSSILVKKSALIEIEKIDATLNYCEDYDLLLKVTKKYNATGIGKHLTQYRMHENNITSRKIFDNEVEVITYLNKYQKNNKLPTIVKINVIMNNSYRLMSLSAKMLLSNKIKNVIYLIFKYYYLILLSPFLLFKKLYQKH
jgi:glycosyltransferase involved in cell wall biosynthesis